MPKQKSNPNSSGIRILLWDIETCPMVVTSWTLFKPRLSHENIRQNSSILCASWKWLGEKEVYSVQVSKRSPTNDLSVVKQLNRVLSEADVLCAHNGDSFDLKFLATRSLVHGLSPIGTKQSIDTYKVAKKHFKLASNRLDYLARLLGIGQKLPTEYSLWLDVMSKKPGAIDRMVEYNKKDVDLLEEVYLKLRPFITNHPNSNLFSEVPCCPNCGGGMNRAGYRYNRTTMRESFRCRSCGARPSGGLVRTVAVR